jgi:hypothetical protein
VANEYPQNKAHFLNKRGAARRRRSFRDSGVFWTTVVGVSIMNPGTHPDRHHHHHHSDRKITCPPLIKIKIGRVEHLPLIKIKIHRVERSMGKVVTGRISFVSAKAERRCSVRSIATSLQLVSKAPIFGLEFAMSSRVSSR